MTLEEERTRHAREVLARALPHRVALQHAESDEARRALATLGGEALDALSELFGEDGQAESLCGLCRLPRGQHAEALGYRDGAIPNCAERCGEPSSSCMMCSGVCPGSHQFRAHLRIERFRGPFAFLSNFWLCDVRFLDWTYPSSEHAYQAMKAASPAEWWPRFSDRALPPGAAKRLGRLVPLRGDWEGVKVDFMRAIVRAKFEQHDDLRRRLGDTAPAELVEGNEYRDAFWGVYRGTGENWLGRVLMDVREALWTPPF